VLVTGPLWARAAWGVFWTWDVRLTSSLLLWLMLVAYGLARRYGGAGGRRLAAAMALFAATDVPLVYLSVNVWRTLHPTTRVVSSLAPGMRLPFFLSLAIFSGLWGVLLTLRMRVERAQSRLLELTIAIEDAEEKSP
jgi:heme exporter protein C